MIGVRVQRLARVVKRPLDRLGVVRRQDPEDLELRHFLVAVRHRQDPALLLGFDGAGWVETRVVTADLLSVDSLQRIGAVRGAFLNLSLLF